MCELTKALVLTVVVLSLSTSSSVVGAEEPLVIGNARQLFVDDFLIRRMDNCRQVVHSGDKDKRNPIGPYCHGGTVIVEKNGTYRMWYSDPTTFKSARGVEGLMLTSRNGIDWEKSTQGVAGLSNDKNVFMPTRAEGRPEHKYWYSPSVFRDDQATNPQERYKLGIWAFNGLCVGFSADGNHWQLHKPFPATTRTRDVLAPCWDPVRKRYLIFCQVNVASPSYQGRVAGVTWSEDFRKWNWGGVILRPDENDPPGMQVHCTAGFWHESVFLGLVQMFKTQPEKTAGKIGSEKEIGYMDIQLGTSRDGLHWKRAPERTPIIPLGSANAGDFDAGYIITSQAPVTVGDEHWLYYSARSWPQYTRGLEKHSQNIQDAQRQIPYRKGMGIIKWPLDRFVSVSADQTSGTLLTKTVVASGEELVVNADASAGRLVVGILDERGQGIAGCGTEDCRVITTDDLRHIVEFHGSKNALKRLTGKPIQLRFQLENTNLYSFQFRSRSKSANQ